ncbi:protein phosphatase 2C domain-containing protein [Streptomyces massasporeus]|uniref:Protein phosphatase 2C domain-containing protein n=1 Tax=Streptomyces massasporeus TaxID=67324 RepID=A0ABW6L8G7_9ACTN
MSQQGGRPTGHEDDWWRELYDDSTDDTGPTPARDSLDDRFASASGAVGDGAEARTGSSDRPAARHPGVEPVVPAPRTGADDLPATPRANTRAPQRAPWEPPPPRPTGPKSFPTAPEPQGRPEPARSEEPPGSASPGVAGPRPATAEGAGEEAAGPPPPTAAPRPSSDGRPGSAAPAAAVSARPSDERTGGAPPPTAVPPPPTAVPPPPTAVPPPPTAAPPSPTAAPPAPSERPGQPPAATVPASGTPPVPPPPKAPPAWPDPEAHPATASGPLASPAPPATAAESYDAVPSAPTDWPPVPPRPAEPPSRDSRTADPRTTEPPAAGPSPVPPLPVDTPPTTNPPPDQDGPRIERPAPTTPRPRGHVGTRPPTYDAEPTALPAADPDDLDDLVADTVLDGARYGACTLRAVSLRGDSARYRGEPRRDSLLTARFGTGEHALLLVAMATGARATPGAHRAAAEACHWIGRAVGRSHARLVEDIRDGRRGDLKSGLHRLTDRSLGKLRASASEQGVDPGEYAASLRCLLLSGDPGCRTRVFFGVGPGGLFRLREGEWQDIEPQVVDVKGEPVLGFGSPPSETPEGDRLTMDLGIPTPPSPYEPAPEPLREPFRFRTSVARPGDTLLMCSGGLAEPLRGEPELGEYLAERWSRPEPPGLAAFLADSQVRVKGYADDRTAAAVWEA